MEWIRRNKLPLWIAGAASVLAIVCTWLFGSAMWREEARASRLGMATLPWVLLLAAGITLLYEKWFGGPSPGPLFVFRRVMFWIFMSFALAIFFVLYGIFIYQIW